MSNYLAGMIIMVGGIVLTVNDWAGKDASTVCALVGTALMLSTVLASMAKGGDN